MGKRLIEAQKAIDTNKIYTFEEGVTLAKKTATTKFVGNIEVHVRLGIDPSKSDQIVRGTVTLPFGTGKIKRVVAFVTPGEEKTATEAGAFLVGGEELIAKIKQTNVMDFDIAIAQPAMMPKLAVIAKLLGPKGLMPNPKTGTVTDDIAKAIKEYSTGKIEFKNDQSGNVHLTIGKTNFEDAQLAVNFKAFMDALNQFKPANLKKEYIMTVFTHATMGPSIRLKK